MKQQFSSIRRVCLPVRNKRLIVRRCFLTSKIGCVHCVKTVNPRAQNHPSPVPSHPSRSTLYCSMQTVLANLIVSKPLHTMQSPACKKQDQVKQVRSTLLTSLLQGVVRSLLLQSLLPVAAKMPDAPLRLARPGFRAYKKACPECCPDLLDAQIAQMQTPVKKRKRGAEPKRKAAKVPLTAQGAAAVDSVLRHINSKEKVADYATTEDEDCHDEDECGLTAKEQAKPCWCKALACWETLVDEKFEEWRDESYPFLSLSALSDTAQYRLKSCTLGRFLTFAGDVDHWHVESVQSMEEWSKRLAEFLER
jgi:hypothetical protein